jgi:hypothetical protein
MCRVDTDDTKQTPQSSATCYSKDLEWSEGGAEWREERGEIRPRRETGPKREFMFLRASFDLIVTSRSLPVPV